MSLVIFGAWGGGYISATRYRGALLANLLGVDLFYVCMSVFDVMTLFLVARLNSDCYSKFICSSISIYLAPESEKDQKSQKKKKPRKLENNLHKFLSKTKKNIPKLLVVEKRKKNI